MKYKDTGSLSCNPNWSGCTGIVYQNSVYNSQNVEGKPTENEEREERQEEN